MRSDDEVAGKGGSDGLLRSLLEVAAASACLRSSV
jgi:hypothetical protein